VRAAPSDALVTDSRHLGRTGLKHAGCPICVWKMAGGQSLEFALNVVFDAPNDRTALVEKQIGCAGIAVERKSNTSSVDQHFEISAHLTNEGQVRVSENHDWRFERTVNLIQFFVRRELGRCFPATLGSSVDNR
jgi:hypothetical protein